MGTCGTPVVPVPLPGMIENLCIHFYSARQLLIRLFFLGFFFYRIFVGDHGLDRPTPGNVIHRIALTMLTLLLRLVVGLLGLSTRLLVRSRMRRLRWWRVRESVARLRG